MLNQLCDKHNSAETTMGIMGLKLGGSKKEYNQGWNISKIRIWGGYLGIEYIFRTYILPSYIQNSLREIEIQREIDREREGEDREI